MNSGIINNFSSFRENRFSVFKKLLEVESAESILDVGGTSYMWRGTGLEERVTLLNLTSPKVEDINAGFTCVEGNALDMWMFRDSEFEVVFSNSVIEHVGNYDDQKRFAKEIKRVGKSYWVQTPNKFFPIEPHLLFPFFQFLPSRLQEWISLRWKYSHLKKWHHNEEELLVELKNIRLLSKRDLVSLFDDSEIYTEKVLGLTKSLVSYKIK